MQELSNLFMHSNNVSRSLSAENPTGEPGRGGMATTDDPTNPAYTLGQGWKVRPCLFLQAGETFEFASVEGPAIIKSIWMTCFKEASRWLVLRIYWDNEATPSVEVPLGDFYCSGWNNPCYVGAVPISVNSTGGYNCYFPMPFRKHCRMTIENLCTDVQNFFYQINYELGDVPADAAYFHAQFRRENPVSYKQPYTIIDGISGKGHFVGCYMAWQVNNNWWWGEGEIKFHMDGDGEFPTICGTGTEDYFGGAWSFEQPKFHYVPYSNLYHGFHQVMLPNGEANNANQRFGLYRFHVHDPIYFKKELKVTMQALGWRNDFQRFLPLRDDIASVAYWYQSEPHAAFPALPSKDELECV